MRAQVRCCTERCCSVRCAGGIAWSGTAAVLLFFRSSFVIRCARNDCAKKIARGCRAERLVGRVWRGNRAGEIGVCSRKTFARAIYILLSCAHKRFFARSVKFFVGEVLRADSVRIRLASRCRLFAAARRGALARGGRVLVWGGRALVSVRFAKMQSALRREAVRVGIRLMRVFEGCRIFFLRPGLARTV